MIAIGCVTITGKSPSLERSSETTPAKSFSSSKKQKKSASCKLCTLFVKPADVAKILNQGLYNKYTSSLDYYYTKDINALLFKKRKAFCIKYYDDLTYDTPKEFLKKSFSIKESLCHMEDIKNFYTKFKDYPRFLETPFVHIMGSMIRRHRRLEYYKVFKGKSKEEPEQTQQLAPGEEFQLIDMLGDSFKQTANRNQVQSVRTRGLKPGESQTVNSSFLVIKKNFKQLKTAISNKNFIDFEYPFSSDYFTYHTTTENYYPLVSANDSHSAIHGLAEIVEELKTEENPKPKLKFTPSTPNTGSAQLRAPFRMNSPKYPTANNLNQFAKPQPTASTPSSQKAAFSTNKIHEQAGNQSLANKILSNPNLSRQNQREQMQSSGRSRSEKEVNSPSVRMVSKSNRNPSSEKAEPQYFKGSQKVNGVGAQGFTPTKNGINNEVLAASLSTNKRKLMIDMQDMNINRTNLYKSITDKFKTSKNPAGTEVQLPAKDLTPNNGPTLTFTSSSTTKLTKTPMSPGKKYIISKRSESAVKSYYLPEHSTAISSNINDENLNRLSSGSLNKKSLRKSTSQGPTDRVLQNYQLNTSGKGTNSSKQIALDEHEVNQVLTIKPTISDPMSQLAGNTSKKFFQGGLSPGLPKTTTYRKNQITNPGFENTQAEKRSSLFDQLIKPTEIPKTAFETNKQNEMIGVSPSFSQAIKFSGDSQRSRSLNPSSSKLKIASPKTRLQSYRDALSNKKRDYSAKNHG